MDSNPTRDAVIERSRLAAIADAADTTPQCRECGNNVAEGSDTCADCVDHEYTVVVYLTMKGKQDLYAMEQALMKAIDRMDNLSGVDCEAVEGVVNYVAVKS